MYNCGTEICVRKTVFLLRIPSCPKPTSDSYGAPWDFGKFQIPWKDTYFSTLLDRGFGEIL